MGSDYDAIDRRDDVNRRWNWLRSKWDPSEVESDEHAVKRDDEILAEWFDFLRQDPDAIRMTEELQERARLVWKQVWEQKLEYVDREGEMGHDDEHNDTDQGVELMSTAEVQGPPTGVLPLALISYTEWNYKAWEVDGDGIEDGQPLPFDVEPGFWHTISEVGVPDSWRDPIRENRTEVMLEDGKKKIEVSYIPRVDELAGEATKRGVPMLAGEGEGQDGALPDTDVMPVFEPTRVLPAIKQPDTEVRPKPTPRSVASVKKRAANRAETPGLG